MVKSFKVGKKTTNYSCGRSALSVLPQVLYRVEVNKATDMKKVLPVFTEPQVIWIERQKAGVPITLLKTLCNCSKIFL